ncbi:MAG: flagellin lysine-N-methylase [Clostridia bacterium]|nr:flagellin lysine-N-methylase [Clostridia bacterium]
MKKGDFLKNLYPDYLKRFKCSSSACRHNCCIGWEIDIDEATLDKYRRTGGETGEKLKRCIAEDEDGAHFILAEGERCPFLNQENLCELIISHGEDFLCDICRAHPRFHNFFTDYTETGLGLCCEEAAKLIINNPETVEFISEGECAPLPDDEKELLLMRDRMLDTARDETLTPAQIEAKILLLANAKPLDLSAPKWADFIETLEKLGDDRDGFVRALKKAETLALPGTHEKSAEQLYVYFIFRHIADSLWDGLLSQRTAFCALAVRLIYTAYLNSQPRDLCGSARVFSSETEYSFENLTAFLEIL